MAARQIIRQKRPEDRFLKEKQAVTVTATNGLLVGGALAAQTGTEVENGTIYVKNPNGSLGAKLKQDADAADGRFKYDPATQEITVSGMADGTELAAFYDVEVEAAKLSNDSEKYSKVLKLYIDVILRDTCDMEYAGQVIIQRADVGGENFAHSFTAESLAGGCSGSTNLWDMIVYGVN